MNDIVLFSEEEFDNFYDLIDETFQDIIKYVEYYGLDWFKYTTAADLFAFVSKYSMEEEEKEEETPQQLNENIKSCCIQQKEKAILENTTINKDAI